MRPSTAQADIASETEGPDGFNKETGRRLVTWRHQFNDGSTLQLLGYFDSSSRAVNRQQLRSRSTPTISSSSTTSIFGSWNGIVWGAGERNFNYVIENTALALNPPNSL